MRKIIAASLLLVSHAPLADAYNPNYGVIRQVWNECQNACWEQVVGRRPGARYAEWLNATPGRLSAALFEVALGVRVYIEKAGILETNDEYCRFEKDGSGFVLLSYRSPFKD